MPFDKSSRSMTASSETGEKKLGQPLPESNLLSERNNPAPHPAQT
jgi:hypothetical protein